jgi:uncharacterized protein YfaS (alpha-2-macroglobulin family)
MLYIDDFVRFAQPGLMGSKGAEYFIAEGIQKITGMQTPSGAFSYWPGGNKINDWASVYACHFLVEARKAGYYYSDDVYDNFIDYLKHLANSSKTKNRFGTIRIYAAYVLALAGQLEPNTLENLKYIDLNDLPVYTRFQYGGAIALAKSPEEAINVLPTKIQPQTNEPETGGYFDSGTRANAILLEILSEIAPENPSIPVLIDAISDDLQTWRWYSTQSTAWGLMAIGKFLQTQEQADYQGTIVVANNRYRDFGVEDISITDKILGGNEIEISINGKGSCYYYWQASGVSSTGEIMEYDDRLKVRREYLDINGKRIDPNSIHLGDQLIAKITATSTDKNLENVVINDLLPACFEIENPRLATSGKIAWLQNKNMPIDYLDIRDDRLLLFNGLRQGNQFEYYYSLRAIAAGDFVLPPVAAECMYEPTIKSAGSSGKIIVTESK